MNNPIFTIFLIFQCPPSAANTTHVSDNFAQDYIWYILRMKVENWESFVYHNFYFYYYYYFLSLAETACFLHHQQPDNLKWEILLHTCHKCFFIFPPFVRWWLDSTASIVKRRWFGNSTHLEKRKILTSEKVEGKQGFCWKYNLSTWRMFWISSPAKR